MYICIKRSAHFLATEPFHVHVRHALGRFLYVLLFVVTNKGILFYLVAGGRAGADDLGARAAAAAGAGADAACGGGAHGGAGARARPRAGRRAAHRHTQHC